MPLIESVLRKIWEMQMVKKSHEKTMLDKMKVDFFPHRDKLPVLIHRRGCTRPRGSDIRSQENNLQIKWTGFQSAQQSANLQFNYANSCTARQFNQWDGTYHPHHYYHHSDNTQLLEINQINPIPELDFLCICSWKLHFPGTYRCDDGKRSGLRS